MQKIISLDEITLSASLMVRSKLQQDVVADYADALTHRKVVFPPVDVFANGKGYILVDGWHRFGAYRLAGKKGILCEVHQGTQDDWLRFALQANTGHGLRRSNMDKRRAVTLALRRWPDQTNAELARLCTVSETFVSECRARMAMPKPVVAEELPREAVPAPEQAEGPQPTTDALGFPIPEKALGIWHRSGEVDLILSALQEIKSALDCAEDSNDPLWHELSFTTAKADVARLLSNVQTARPYTVCTSCQGQLADSCTLCGGKGFISRFRWETCVPEEIKTMRLKGLEK